MFKLRSIAEQNAATQTAYDVQQLKLYAQALDGETNPSTEQLNTLLIGTSESARTFATRIREDGVAVGQYAEQVQNANAKIKSGFFSNALTFGKSLAKGLFTGLIITAGMKILEAGWKFLDKNIINKTKYLNESVDKLMDSYNESRQKADQYKSSMESLIPTYNELSTGVDSLGNNVSLTEEEFEKYKDTANQIAEMCPNLVTGFTAEGDAIISLTGVVDALTESYKEMRKQAAQTLIDGADDIIEKYNAIANKKQSFTVHKPGGMATVYASKKEQVGLLTEFAQSDSQSASKTTNDYVRLVTGLGNSTDIENVVAAQKKAIELAKEYQKEIDESYGIVKNVANAYLTVNDDYLNMTNDVQAAVSKMITAADFEGKSKEDVAKYVNGIVDAVKDNKDAQAALIQLFSIDKSKLNPNEYKAMINQLITEITKYVDGLDPIQIKIALGIDKDESDYNFTKYMKNAAYVSGGMNGEYVYGRGYVETIDEEWRKKYEDFLMNNGLQYNDAEQRKLLELIQLYGDLDKAQEEYYKRYLNNVKEVDGYLDYSNKKDKSNYAGSDYVNDAQSDIKALGDMLKQLQDGTLDPSALVDFFQDFPEFESRADDLEKAISEKLVGAIDELEKATGKKLSPQLKQSLFELTGTALQANRSLSDTFNTIKNSSQVLKDFDKLNNEGKPINESLLSSIAGLSEELETMVAGFYGGVVTVEELYDAVQKQRELDLTRYKEAYILKEELNQSTYENAINGHAKEVKEFNKQYKVDLKNYTNYQMAKLEVQKKVLGKEADSVSRYYDIRTGEYTAAYEQLKKDARNAVGNASVELFRVDGIIKDAANVASDLDKTIGWTDFMDAIEDGFGGFDDLLDSSKDYYEIFDFFERRLTVINQELEKLDANLENVNSAAAKNSLITGKIKLTQSEINDYKKALGMYQEMANKALSKLSADLQAKIKSGAVNLTTLIGENGEEVNKNLEEYQKWADKVNDCNQQLIALKETLRDFALDRFNNIVQQYQDRFDLLGSSRDLIEKQISLVEEGGKLVGKALYESQITVLNDQKSTLEKEKSELIKEFSVSLSSGLIQKGTDEWLEMVKAIQELDQSILDCDQSVEQFQNSILELADQAFERLQNSISDVKSQIENIDKLLQDEKVSSEEGVWTAEGLTRLGGYAQAYEMARHNVELYQKEIDRVNQAYADGLYSTTEYLEKITDLTQAQWEEAHAAEDAKDAIVDVNKARVDAVKDGIQKQIDAYKKLIDERKKALSQAKDMHDWEKTLAEKDKNIAKLRNRLALLANDDSAAANAERVKVQQELQEALYDLEETQYDHSIQAQQDALDQSYENFEKEKDEEIKKMEEYLEDVETVFKDSLEVVKKNTSVITETLTKIVDEQGVYISETLFNAWAMGGDAIASYGQELTTATSGFILELSKVEDYLIALQMEADTTASFLVDMLSTKATGLVNQFDAAMNAELELLNTTKLLRETLSSTFSGNYGGSTGSTGSAFSSVGGNKNLYVQKETPVEKTNEEKLKDAQKQYEELNNTFGYKKYYDPENMKYLPAFYSLERQAPYSYGADKEFKEVVAAIDEYKKKRDEIMQYWFSIPGYANGVHGVNSNQLARTQEKGLEAILSPSRNGILTPLKRGDSVLTKEQTENLFRWGKLSPEMIVKNGALLSLSASKSPTLSIGNVLTVNGNIDDSNVEKMKNYVTRAIDSTFKKFSSEIIKK